MTRICTKLTPTSLAFLFAIRLLQHSSFVSIIATMPTEEEVTAAMKSALESQPREVLYPDYETTEDFPLWLSGYAAKIRNAYGYGLDDDDMVKAEVVRSICGRMSVGRALETYNGLSITVKENYAQMFRK